MSVYNEFAEDYNNKRNKPWKAFIEFFFYLKKREYRFHGTIIDLGCANGRHFTTIKNYRNRLIAIDNSKEFLKISKKRIEKDFKSKYDLNTIQLVLSDMNYLPIRNDQINTIFSIATIHHIQSYISRKIFFYNIFNILKNNSLIIFSVWRRWQKKYRFFFFKDFIHRKLGFTEKRKKFIDKNLEFGDIIIPWNLSSRKKVIKRYYHLFSFHELKTLLKKFNIKKIKKLGGPGNKDNFFILAKKSY